MPSQLLEIYIDIEYIFSIYQIKKDNEGDKDIHSLQYTQHITFILLCRKISRYIKEQFSEKTILF